MNIARQKIAALGLSLVVTALTGCASGKFTRWVSPQISGRVLAADTHQPLAGVNVARDRSQQFEPFGSPKGGQLLMQSGGVPTDAEGRYVLPGESVVAVFRQSGWWSVPVAYSCSGYETFQTNYTGASVGSHSAEGMPEIQAGDVLLKPSHR